MKGKLLTHQMTCLDMKSMKLNLGHKHERKLECRRKIEIKNFLLLVYVFVQSNKKNLVKIGIFGFC